MKNKIYLNIKPGISVASFPNELASIKAWGFDGAEISLDTFPLIISGKTNQPFLDYIRPILKEHDLSYSAHIGLGLDLRNIDNLFLHMSVLYSSINICAQLGLNPLVLHYEQDSGNSEVERQFINCHAKAADYAAKHSIALVLENIEVEHYKPVLETVKAINHPNLTMALDVGHLYISSKYFGFSFEDAIKECAPYVGHCHISDNTGIFEPMRLSNFDLYRTLPMGYRIAYGRGDIHMPPLYCNVPIPFAVNELKNIDYVGIYTCEYPAKDFQAFNTEICRSVRRLIEA